MKIKIYINLQLERTIIFILNSSVAWQALHHVSSYAKWVSVQKFWKLFGFRFKSHEKDDKGKKVEFSCLSFIVVLHYYLLWCPYRPILGYSIVQESSCNWITFSFKKKQFYLCDPDCCLSHSIYSQLKKNLVIVLLQLPTLNESCICCRAWLAH